MSLILAIDQGTTSSRAIVFDASGNSVAIAQEEFPQIYPQPGWVEHDPEAIWRTTLATAKRALEQAEAKDGRVIAIGITNQRETTLLWERESLKPVGNAIVWQDRRTTDICSALKSDGVELQVQNKTGLLLDPYFSATKLAWLLDNYEGAREKAEAGKLAFGTVDSFLLARLTGAVHATDATNASRTSLFNIRTQAWDDDLLKLFKAPRACLPEVRDNVSVFGETLVQHFGRPIPVYAMVGDQQAAAAGQACFSRGDVKSTYGTGCFVIAPTGDDLVISKNRLLSTIALRLEGRVNYALEGSIFVAGAAVQWLRDSLQIVSSAAETEALARSIDDTRGVYLVPGFTGLGAPHWVPEARGLISGLTRGAGRAEIARAALESVVYQTADLLAAMAKDGAPVSTLKVDGGMVANDWLLEYLASILDVQVERPAILETTALGAAYLAGLKAGVYTSLDDIARNRIVDRRFSPDMSADLRTKALSGWRKAVERALLV